jgi:hypothetical protein
MCSSWTDRTPHLTVTLSDTCNLYAVPFISCHTEQQNHKYHCRSSQKWEITPEIIWKVGTLYLCVVITRLYWLSQQFVCYKCNKHLLNIFSLFLLATGNVRLRCLSSYSFSFWILVSVKKGRYNKRWFKYDRNYLCVNKSQFVPVIFEPPCISALMRFTPLEYNYSKSQYLFTSTTFLLFILTATYFGSSMSHHVVFM